MKFLNHKMVEYYNGFILIYNQLMHAELDSDLEAAIIDAEKTFAGNIKRGFTNVAIKHFNFPPVRTKDLNIFDAISIKENDNVVILKNLQLYRPLTPRMRKIVPNLAFNVMETEIDLNNIFITGNYEISNSQLLDIIPAPQEGMIEIVISSVKAVGAIGISRQGDIYQSINFDLEYDTGEVQITYIYQTGNGTEKMVTIEKNNLNSSLLWSVRHFFWNSVTQLIQKRLNKVLADLSIFDTFRENEEILGKQIERQRSIDLALNHFIDKFVAELRKDYASHNLSYIDIPNFETTFSYLSGPFTVNGKFAASNGYIHDILSVERRGLFSIYPDKENQKIILFGSLGFNNLELVYNDYIAKLAFLEPRGKIYARAGDNMLSFRFTSPNFVNGIPDFKQIQYKININRLEQLKFELTGFDDGPLDWLASRIATWIGGVFKTGIVNRVENEIRSQIDTFLNS